MGGRLEESVNTWRAFWARNEDFMDLIEIQVFNRILANQGNILISLARNADTHNEAGYLRECVIKTDEIRQRLITYEETTKPTNPS
jgi:hypothetical protein